METYVFDGSMPGLLTALFESYERKAKSVKVMRRDLYQPSLLGDTLDVVTDDGKARRVWDGLAARIDRKWLSRWYVSFLAGQQAGDQHLFDLSRSIFDYGGKVVSNYGDPNVLYIAQLDRKVHREKHRMQAFVRFQLLTDGLYYAAVEPDYNVLPLLQSHFKNRYASQRWMIYDLKRSYGIYYDGGVVKEVTLSFASGKGGGLAMDLLAADEVLYQRLWKSYFEHTNIVSRKNTKLHMRHVPTRYWKYLTEKKLFIAASSTGLPRTGW